MSSPLEKSAQMENRYVSLGEDPWGNRERQLYQKILKKAVQLSYDHLETYKGDNQSDIVLYDIGAGGGNVIDVWTEHLPEKFNLKVCGCDISNKAIEYLETRYPDSKFDQVDLEEYYSKDPLENLANADIVSIVDVMYYFDVKRDYKLTLDEIWDTIKPGAIVLVADNLVRHFRRDYFKKKVDSCEVLEEFTDFTEKICEETSESGKKWNRYLKIRLYHKI